METKNRWEPFFKVGNFRECRTSIPTTLCSDFIALVPDTHQLWWFFSRWLISLKWIQLLCHCLISLSLDWFSHESRISVLPLPTTRSKELLLYVFRKYIRQPMSRYRSRISPPLNSPQVCPGLPYGLLKDTHCSVNSIRS